MNHDDTVYLRKPTARTTVVRTQGELNAAARQGTIVETSRATKVSNRAHHVDTDHRRIAQLDRSDDVRPPEPVKLTVSKAISKARMDKKITQKELATKINERDTLIRDYEGGKVAPDQQVLSKTERVLGVKLRGKDIGEPLPARGSAKKK